MSTVLGVAAVCFGAGLWFGLGYIAAHEFPTRDPAFDAMVAMLGPVALVACPYRSAAWKRFKRRFLSDEEEGEDMRNPPRPFTRLNATTDHSPVESDEPLTGYRQWRLFRMEDGTLRLVSSIRPFTYDGPVVQVEKDEVTEGHGLHAAKDGDRFYDPAAEYPVEGEVELFGRVVEGSRGYRAEKLRISKLYLYPGGWGDPEQLPQIPQPTTHNQFVGWIGTSHEIPGEAERQFRSDTRTETPWPHPWTEIREELEERYRCDVELCRREGSQILGPDSSKGSTPRQTRFHFVQRPSDAEIAKYSNGGDLWTPRERETGGEEGVIDINLTPPPSQSAKCFQRLVRQYANNYARAFTTTGGV